MGKCDRYLAHIVEAEEAMDVFEESRIQFSRFDLVVVKLAPNGDLLSLAEELAFAALLPKLLLEAFLDLEQDALAGFGALVENC